MVRRLVLFNVLLLAIAVAGVVKLRRDVGAFSAGHQISSIQALSEKPLPKAADVVTVPPREDWTEVATRNPFSFDRNDVTLVATTAVAAQAQRPKPVLFGTMLLGADRIALLSSAEAANKSSRPLRVGELIDGWTLVEIADRSVVVRWNEVKETLILSEAQVVRDYTKTAASGFNPAPVGGISAASPAAASAGQPAPTPANTAPPASSSGRRQIVIQTPFGPKTMEDPSQP